MVEAEVGEGRVPGIGVGISLWTDEEERAGVTVHRGITHVPTSFSFFYLLRVVGVVHGVARHSFSGC